ncbi:MAG: hypothetical protein KAY82_05125 [Hylemonella sp.]|nr:hypothetical protein [Hylemonella sp.]
MLTREPCQITPELVRIRHEAWSYGCKKPNKAPPADSLNRPTLARLWWVAHQALRRRPKQRTFKLHGARFAVVYVGDRLGVIDIAPRKLLVLAPTSMAALASILNLQGLERE